MLVPPIYRADDLPWIQQLIADNPLATLVTAVDGRLTASHVPVIIGSPADDQGRLVLAGHMNRDNPQWPAIEAGCPGLLVFTGPHGYVSPTVYGYTPAAPTWDFTAVHASGTIRADQSTLDLIRATVRGLEGRFGAGWDMGESLGYFDQLLPGVGAYTMAVDTLESMRKLSQEQEPPVRARVADSFAARDCGCHGTLAEMIRRYGD